MNRDLIYLSALLHDIGKFYQRADHGSVAGSKCLKEHVKQLEGSFCPKIGETTRYSHKHVLWTAQFIDDYWNTFKELSGAGNWQDGDIKDTLLHLAASHHLPVNVLTEAGRLIREADHLSAGMDRSDIEAFKDDQDTEGWDAFMKIRMRSVFEGLLMKQNEVRYQYTLPVCPVSLSADNFPQKTFNVNPDYAGLWEAFTREFKTILQTSNIKAFSETLLNLLLKYTSTVPSSTVNFPDVSLYDHLKTTASLAVCLSDWKQDGKPDDDPFMMIGGDFSGIQSYIYNIISKGAAKNLKGRSFYLKLLSDSVVYFLLKELDLYTANVIYNSGGSFYILAPNTEKSRSAFREAVATIERKIFETHHTDIYVAIDAITLNKQELMSEDGLAKAWDRLFEVRNQKKNTKWAALIDENFDLFFKAGEIRGDEKRDAITGEEISEAEASKAKSVKEDDLDVEEVWMKELTWKQQQLGRLMRSAELWVVSDGPLAYWKDDEGIDPAGLGFYYYFLSRGKIRDKRSELKASADRVRVYSVNAEHFSETDLFDTILKGSENIYGNEYFGGNDFPADSKGDPKTFDELAGTGKLKRLGILRMDVDNLGMIFQAGFRGKRSSLSRYAALSRSLDWFFKGYLNTIWKQDYYRDHTYILYSGGDDLFLVGKWNLLIQLAEKIRNDFGDFTCHNPFITLSGGIALVGAKYPVKRAAAESEAEEKNAKRFSHRTDSTLREKDAISFFETALGWDREFLAVKQIRERIKAAMPEPKSTEKKGDESQSQEEERESKKGMLRKSFLSKLVQHFANAHLKPEFREIPGKPDLKSEQEVITNPRTFYMMAYDFGRMLETVKNNPLAKDLINDCIYDITNKTILREPMPSKYHPLRLWYMAARWVGLEERSDDSAAE